MGFIHEPTPEMGPFRVETRRESFCLRKESTSEEPLADDGIFVYLQRYPTVSEAGYQAIEKAVRDLVAAEQRGDPQPVLNGWRIAARSACEGAVTVVRTGTVEISYSDIPALTAALMQVCESENLVFPGLVIGRFDSTEPPAPRYVAQADSIYREHP